MTETSNEGCARKLLPFDSFGLNLTYECNLRCQFCVYNSGSALSGFMPLPLMEEIVLGARDFWAHHGIDATADNDAWRKKKVENRRAGIHLSGGEVFLDFDYVCAAIDVVRRAGVHLQFVQTNGFWVTTPEATRGKLLQLKAAGLERIFFSSTPFHAEFIPVARLRLALALSEEVFGAANVHVRERHMLELLSALGPEDRTVPLHRFIEFYGVPYFVDLMFEYGLSFMARAAERLDFVFPRKPLSELQGKDCHEELLEARHSHIDPYGNWIPWACGGLSFGKVGRDIVSFYEDFDLSRYPLSAALCSAGGIGKLLRIGQERGFVTEAAGYVDKCHLCWDLRAFLARNAGDEFPELAPRDFYVMPEKTWDPRVVDLVARHRNRGSAQPTTGDAREA